MKTVTKISAIIILSVLFHQSAFSQWVPQVSGTTQNIRAMQVLSTGTVYAAGITTTLLKTTNGGTNWISVAVPTTISLLCMHFLDANTGYIGGDGGGVFKTTNAGVNWINVSVNPTTPAALNIFFSSASTGYLAGNSGFIRKTTNSGVNWTSITSGTTDDINTIVFIDANTGWFGSGTVSTNSGNLVRKTTNAGATWTTQLTVSGFITSIAMVDASTGYATSRAQIYKTTNGGTNWTGLNPGPIGVVNSIVIGGSTSILYVCGASGKIFKTSTSGTNWSELESGTTNSLKEIDLVPGSNTIGWIAGNGGTILKTTNGGGNPISAITPNSGEIPQSFFLQQNYPNPFNPSSKIRFDIPSAGNSIARAVQLKVYDVLGNEIALLVNEALQPGSYEIEFDAKDLPTGTYFYRLSANGFTQTKKMVLIK